MTLFPEVQQGFPVAAGNQKFFPSRPESLESRLALSLQGEPLSKAFQETPRVRDVEVDVLSEVGADVGVSVHQSAVERSPAYADHHGDQTQQQQDETGVSSDVIYEENTKVRDQRWRGDLQFRFVAPHLGLRRPLVR